MKRTLSLVLAVVCLLAICVKECEADCEGSRLGKRIQSGLSRVAGVPCKVKQARAANRAANCSASVAVSVPVASSCSAPVMSCSAPAVVPIASVEPLMAVPVSAPVFEARGSHWSYPGNITTHLQSDHGQNAFGLSVEQQLTLHDSLHESQPRQAIQTRYVPTSNCPGGVCPNPSSNRAFARPFLFGR